MRLLFFSRFAQRRAPPPDRRSARRLQNFGNSGGGVLHWNRAYRDLMAHPAVVPILEQLCGARFRLDHINVHTHVAAGYSGSSLHGGSNPGGGNGFYHYQGGQMRNGLVAVTWELEDTHCNGGGFCCIPGSERAAPLAESRSA